MPILIYVNLTMLSRVLLPEPRCYPELIHCSSLNEYTLTINFESNGGCKMLYYLMPEQEGLWGLRLHSYVDLNFYFKFLTWDLKNDRSSLIGYKPLSP
jgi:hypothetical protein